VRVLARKMIGSRGYSRGGFGASGETFRSTARRRILFNHAGGHCQEIS
jgi:hypothetical protein